MSFGRFPDSVYHTKHSISRYDVSPGLCNSLHIHGVIQIGNVAKDVVSYQCKDEIAVQDAFGQLGIPYEIVRIHYGICKATV